MSVRRPIITIDEAKCTGCGECIPNCPEGALQIIDGKARLISDLFCDGLGACIGHCPEGAISIEEREAEPYDERRVMEQKIIPQGRNVVRAHLEHLRDHDQDELLEEALAVLEERDTAAPELGPEAAASGCPGARAMELEGEEAEAPGGRAPSQLRQWPVQIALVPPGAPWLEGADLVVVADCVPFATANLHEDFLKGRRVLVGCPKLDDADFYRRKLALVFERGDPRSVEVVHMEVPCCFGLVALVRQALADAGKSPPLSTAKVSLQGETLERREVETEEATP
ncbi:MAG: ATP-binding protein [Candidatus Brocadiia bacterium]